MDLIAKISADQLQARKEKNVIARALLTTLMSDANMVAKNAGREAPSNDEVLAVVRKFLKGNAEVMEHATQEDQREIAKQEAEILAKYLPKQLSKEELEKEVAKAILQGCSNVGMVMAYLKTNFAGQYDGKLASSVIKDLLQ